MTMHYRTIDKTYKFENLCIVSRDMILYCPPFPPLLYFDPFELRDSAFLLFWIFFFPGYIFDFVLTRLILATENLFIMVMI